MFDFPDNKELQTLTEQIFDNDGVVGAVCHGTAGLLNVKLSDGENLLSQHEVAGFSNEEEESVGMEKVVPFLLQTKIEESGADYTSSPKFSAHVVKSGRLVTGQNPASAAGVGLAMVEVLDFIEEGRSVPEQNWCEWKEPREHSL
jgi:putative intracellular protease/amidase